MSSYFVLGLSWLAYFTLHSWLASLRVKQWVSRHWPAIAARYRLLYNLLASLLLIPPVWLLMISTTPTVWQWTGIWAWVSHALLAFSLLGFWLTSRYYDMPAFIGLKPSTATGFSLSPIHRFVRHPWYFFGLVLLWSRDMDVAWLMVVSLATLYLWFGSRLEDKKLVEEFGELYEGYRQRVPGLFPWPGKMISKQEAQRLLSGRPL